MFSTANKLSVIGIILGVLNLIVAAMLLLYFRSAGLGFALTFCGIIYLVTTSVILMLLACGLRGAAQDMTLNDESYMSRITDLRKRVEYLEKRTDASK